MNHALSAVSVMAPDPVLASYLEMTTGPRGSPHERPFNAEVSRQCLDAPTYLRLYQRVGGSLGRDKRLKMTAGDLRAYLSAATTDVYTLTVARRTIGFCEFDRSGAPGFELCNFGVVASLQGRGLGPYLLDRALREVWIHQPQRIWLHTDEQDHPAAIRTYERVGFRLFDRCQEDPDDLQNDTVISFVRLRHQFHRARGNLCPEVGL
jgi:GNAT superfamily N-acetyltransferase